MGWFYSTPSDPTSPGLLPNTHQGDILGSWQGPCESKPETIPYSKIVPEEEVCGWVICLFPQVSHNGGWNSLITYFSPWLLHWEIKARGRKYIFRKSSVVAVEEAWVLEWRWGLNSSSSVKLLWALYKMCNLSGFLILHLYWRDLISTLKCCFKGWNGYCT